MRPEPLPKPRAAPLEYDDESVVEAWVEPEVEADGVVGVREEIEEEAAVAEGARDDSDFETFGVEARRLLMTGVGGEPCMAETYGCRPEELFLSLALVLFLAPALRALSSSSRDSRRYH